MIRYQRCMAAQGSESRESPGTNRATTGAAAAEWCSRDQHRFSGCGWTASLTLVGAWNPGKRETVQPRLAAGEFAWSDMASGAPFTVPGGHINALQMPQAARDDVVAEVKAGRLRVGAIFLWDWSMKI